jgi:hypothetical protein
MTLSDEPHFSLPRNGSLTEYFQMRCLRVLTVLCLFTSALMAHPARRSRPATSDANYAAALATANRFLHAWQTQDHETGIMMLSDEARQQISPERLDEFFSPSGSTAFEIQHGKRLNAGKYAFPVALFGLAGGSHDRAHVCRIVVVRAGKQDWAIEKLP